MKTIIVSGATHSFLIKEKYKGNFDSVDSYLKKKLKIKNVSEAKNGN